MLLRYREQVVSVADRVFIRKHLIDCDFCSAEFELLKRHQLEAEEARSVEMPSRLRWLAESAFVKNRALSRISSVVVYSGRLSH